MSVPGTFKKPSILREIEALRIKPGEVLLLRFTEAFKMKEVEIFDAALKQGPLAGRVVCIQVPAEVETFVVDAPVVEPKTEEDDGGWLDEDADGRLR